MTKAYLTGPATKLAARVVEQQDREERAAAERKAFLARSVEQRKRMFGIRDDDDDE